LNREPKALNHAVIFDESAAVNAHRFAKMRRQEGSAAIGKGMESGGSWRGVLWGHLLALGLAGCTLDGSFGDAADADHVKHAPDTAQASGAGGASVTAGVGGAMANDSAVAPSRTDASSENAMGGAGGTSIVNDDAVKADGPKPAADASIDYNTPLVCTSGDHWVSGDRGAASMHPGVACIACHTAKQGPAFSAAGTVYPTAHEPDDCNGIDGLFTGATVYITGADGQTVHMLANFAGNFNFPASTKIALPFRAKVVVDGRERAMTTPQMIGDCNACHTATGKNGAPGRIVAP